MTHLVALVLGYIASVLLAISLLVNNDLKFRLLNTFGCLSFVLYGILINALPVILTNSILLLINLFYLVKIYRTKENFDLLEIKAGNKIIDKFLSFHQKDIQAYFPEFRTEDMHDGFSFIVLRDIVIANIFVARLTGDGNAIVSINYTVPKYRDFKVGRFIFEKEKNYLLSKGIKQIVYKKVFNKQHENFLLVNDFKKQIFDGAECFTKSL